MSKQRNFFRFLGYVRPYTVPLALGIIGGLVKFTVPLFVPQVTRHLLDDVFLNSVMTPAQKSHEVYFWIGLLIAVYVFFFAPWVYIRHYCTSIAGHRSVFDLRCALYFRILRMSMSFFGRNRSGGIVSRMISDVQLAQNLVGSALTNVWMDTAAIVVVLIFLVRIDLGITLVALVTFPFYIAYFKRISGKIRSSSHEVQEEIANLSGNITEKVSGNVVVQAFAQEKREEKLFHKDSERVYAKTMRTQWLQSMNLMVTGTVTAIAPLLVLMYGGQMVLRGSLTVGELIAITMWLGPLYLPLQRFSELNVIFANSMAALDRIFEIMDEQPEIRDTPDAIPLTDVRGHVVFEDVHFSYNPDEPVLRGVNFEAWPGRRIALVGPSGSGKSTLVSLIPRFYDPSSGKVMIDGRDVRDIKLKSLRQHIGMVLQDPILFSGSLKDNILYGCPTASETALVEACKAANAWNFIQELPAGLDTEVGERGGFLSGGQRQRITIARAFLTNPEILILDEPTSAMDAESESLIQDALERLMAGKTTFIIAHRLSTIIRADIILVLDHGLIAERGVHAELLELDGVYRGLYDKQFALTRLGDGEMRVV